MVHQTCMSCGIKFSCDAGGDNVPLVLPCFCVMCKQCLLQQEAEARSAAASATGGGGKKSKGEGKKKEKEPMYNGMACKNCSKVCNVPVEELHHDVALLKVLSSGAEGSAAAPKPLCDHCEEELATQYCSSCRMNQQMACDGCHSVTHKSAKKQGHVSVPIQDHLSSSAAAFVKG